MIDGIPLWFIVAALLLTAAVVGRAWWLDNYVDE